MKGAKKGSRVEETVKAKGNRKIQSRQRRDRKRQQKRKAKQQSRSTVSGNTDL